MASFFTNDNLDKWISNNMNVLLRGKHGVGKTARILEAFKRNGLKYQYFSAATMDPWVDFIGVPKERTDENGNSYLDLVRPKVWQDDSVEAVFLDEYNRSSKKVRNAVMELIQFKSINGRVFKNLKVVWAAINPEDEDAALKYDVEALDPAQMDRFHVIIEVPYKPDAEYFRTTHGKDMADSAIGWWANSLKDEERDRLSPRRLDAILKAYGAGLDIKPMVHDSINLNSLINQLRNGPIVKQVENLFETKNTMGAMKFVANENNFAAAIHAIVKTEEYMAFFLPLVPSERMVSLMNAHQQVKSFVFGNFDSFRDLISSIAASKTGQLTAQAASVMANNVKFSTVSSDPAFQNPRGSESDLQMKLQSVEQMTIQNPQQRKAAFGTLLGAVPSTMSPQTGSRLLKVLYSIAVASNPASIVANMRELPAVVVHTVKLLEDAGVDVTKVIDTRQLLTKLNEVETNVRQANAVANTTTAMGQVSEASQP